MAKLHNQPLSFRFGTYLQSLIENERWSNIEVGVAWVRRSGTQYLLPSLTTFLKRGGVFRISVGIDIENTSEEGLSDLLSLEEYGTSETYVYHNEAPSTYHPKVYLFSNQHEAKLVIGSNNLTEAGLFLNVEASLEVDALIGDSLIKEAKDALAEWKDPSLRLALRLTKDLLSDLVRFRYVMSEASLRSRRPRRDTRATSKGEKTAPLFGRQPVTPPVFRFKDMPSRNTVRKTAKPLPQPVINHELEGSYQSDLPTEDESADIAKATTNTGKVLLMRVRRASATSRRTQTQLPIQLSRDSFFEGITEIISAYDNTPRRLSPARAREGINTIKIEIPEMRDFQDPVLRLEHTAEGVVYKAYDASSIVGKSIIDALQEGRNMSPPETILTTPRSPETSTMWRFI